MSTVSSSNKTGVYIALPVYLVFMGGAAVWARRQSAKLEHDGVESQITSHFLGGRKFGPIVTAATFFASFFSGYTVVGIPNDAFRDGFFASWWIPSSAMIVMGVFGTGLRMRRCSMTRNHQSPLDLITDRFQSQLLRYTVFILQLFPSLIYLSVQVVALQGTFSSLFDASSVGFVCTVMALIVAFEWIGGLTSVAMTDVIQAIIMVLSSAMLPLVILHYFGGWNDIDANTYPKPEFYLTPSKEQQWEFWQLSMINFSFLSLPHFIQRNYAAKDLASLRAGYYAMACGPWLMMLVGVFVGTVGVKILGPLEEDPASPLWAILEQVMNKGGFGRFAGVMTMTATFAAIMSTADSLLIAISHLVICEVVHPLLAENTTSNKIMWSARFASLVAACIAILIGLSGGGLKHLSQVQFPVSVQSVPAFVVALFATNRETDIHPWCLASGAITGTAFVFAVFFGYLLDNDDALPLSAGVTGVILNVVVALSCELTRRAIPGSSSKLQCSMSSEDDEIEEEQLLFPDRPSWDIPRLSQFGDKVLSPERVWELMDGLAEPMTSLCWVGFITMLVTIVTPLTAENSPPLADSTVAAETGSPFLYPPAVINGLPWWVFKLFIIVIIPYLLLLVSISRMPLSFEGVKRATRGNKDLKLDMTSPVDESQEDQQVRPIQQRQNTTARSELSDATDSFDI